MGWAVELPEVVADLPVTARVRAGRTEPGALNPLSVMESRFISPL
ncbi:hypothetical protein ASAP_0563 [Asaia bogorensis]|uniref:Uncharacterized protein n=1 Tax=Asaia bogorensis TaxID=91915 RepID=A0A060QD40_9PROT|nr:hypothetical protein ASAP_0563 [Asaia bogorensis]